MYFSQDNVFKTVFFFFLNKELLLHDNIGNSQFSKNKINHHRQTVHDRQLDVQDGQHTMCDSLYQPSGGRLDLAPP